MAIGTFKLPISSGADEFGWVRPSDWLAMPSVLITDDKFVGLHAIYPNGNNFAAFLFTTSTGQYQVDWGDGSTPTLHNSNTLAQYAYDYATYDVGNTTLSTRGYKQAIITVTAVSGLLRTCDFNRKYVSSPVQTTVYTTGFLECILSMPNASTGNSIIFGGSNNVVAHRFVEKFDIKTIGSVNNLQYFFNGCSSLQSVPLFNTASVTNMSVMFNSCQSLQSVPLFNTVSVTNMTNMFSGCASLQSVPLFNTASVTNMSVMFNSCQSLQSVPLFNTASVTNMSIMFNSCQSLQSVPALSTASITTSSGTDFTNTFQICYSLDRVEMIFSRSVTLTSCQLSQTALVEIFNNLTDRTATTSANINITGNWGASALTAAERLIATSKNWSITG